MLLERHEVEAAVASAFPGRALLNVQPLKPGFDFDVRRVDFRDGESVVFRGQKNQVSAYLGRIDWGRVLADEIEFYRLLPDLPVPGPIHFEPNEAALGFPYAFFTYLPGTPLDDLLSLASVDQRHAVAREMGALLARIHAVRLDRVGRLSRLSSESWGAYFGHRMRRRLEPHARGGLLTPREVDALVEKASGIELDQPRLLHMDFRAANMLATLDGGTIRITGVVDAANSLAGDPALDLARSDEGVGLDADFWTGYESVRGEVARDSEAYLLYRLETAALLAHVYEGSAQEAFRLERLQTLRVQLA